MNLPLALILLVRLVADSSSARFVPDDHEASNVVFEQAVDFRGSEESWACVGA